MYTNLQFPAADTLEKEMSEEPRSLATLVKKNGIPSFWSNTGDMQAAYTMQVKGWTRSVTWRDSTVEGAGLGVFASEFIPAGTVYRVLREGENLLVLRGPEDLPHLAEDTTAVFCDYVMQISGLCCIMLPGNLLISKFISILNRSFHPHVMPLLIFSNQHYNCQNHPK